MVFEAVCVLFKENKTDWKTSQKLLQNVNQFVTNLKTFDKDNIDQKTIKKLKKLLANPEFTYDNVKTKISYAADIAGFCLAMDKFSDINVVVKPKKELAAKLQLELQDANDALDTKMSELQAVKDKVDALNKEL